MCCSLVPPGMLGKKETCSREATSSCSCQQQPTLSWIENTTKLQRRLPRRGGGRASLETCHSALATVPGTPHRPRFLPAVPPSETEVRLGAGQPGTAYTCGDTEGRTVPETASAPAVPAGRPRGAPGTTRPPRPLRSGAHLQLRRRRRREPSRTTRHGTPAPARLRADRDRPDGIPRGFAAARPGPSAPGHPRSRFVRSRCRSCPPFTCRRGAGRLGAAASPPASPSAPRPASPAHRPRLGAGCSRPLAASLRPLPRLQTSGQGRRGSIAGHVLRGTGGSWGGVGGGCADAGPGQARPPPSPPRGRAAAAPAPPRPGSRWSPGAAGGDARGRSAGQGRCGTRCRPPAPAGSGGFLQRQTEPANFCERVHRAILKPPPHLLYT